jgi:hypothetical protein
MLFLMFQNTHSRDSYENSGYIRFFFCDTKQRPFAVITYCIELSRI